MGSSQPLTKDLPAISFNPSTHFPVAFWPKAHYEPHYLREGCHKREDKHNAKKLKAKLNTFNYILWAIFRHAKLANLPQGERWKVIPVACWVAISVTYSSPPPSWPTHSLICQPRRRLCGHVACCLLPIPTICFDCYTFGKCPELNSKVVERGRFGGWDANLK